MKTYRLGSSGLIYAPGVIAWAINGYHFPRDRKNMLRVICDGWAISVPAARALLSGKVAHRVEGDAVVFSVKEA